MYILKDAHITTLSQIVHIEVVNILHLVPPFLLDAQIFWDNDSYIICSAHTDCLIESEKQGVLRSRLIRPLRLEAQDTALSRR